MADLGPTARGPRYTQLATRAGLNGAGVLDGKGEFYASPGFPGFEHSTTDFQSNLVWPSTRSEGLPSGSPQRFKMRALASPGPGYLYWTVDTAPDPTGSAAPGPIIVGSAVVAAEWPC
jgi:hypothetical protein